MLKLALMLVVDAALCFFPLCVLLFWLGYGSKY